MKIKYRFFFSHTKNISDHHKSSTAFRRAKSVFIYLIIFIVVTSCQNNNKHTSPIQLTTSTTTLPQNKISTHYAEGFRVTYESNCKKVEIRDYRDTTKIISRLLLIPKGSNITAGPQWQVVETPVDRVICLTSIQLSYLLKLELNDHICGISGSRYLYNKDIRQRLKEKKIQKIGREGNFKSEIALSLAPDLIFVSPFKVGGYDKLKNLGLNLIPVTAYKEKSALAMAEWLKFFALFFNQEKKATELFDSIENRYYTLQKLAQKAETHPTIFSGQNKSGIWYAVGGESVLAKIFKDAGAKYIFDSNKDSGALRLDFETVYNKAAHADYWRMVQSFDGHISYPHLKSLDERYGDFDAFKNRRVIFCNLKTTPFYEAIPVCPEVVLADFIKALHPELLPDYRPQFYKTIVK